MLRVTVKVAAAGSDEWVRHETAKVPGYSKTQHAHFEVSPQSPLVLRNILRIEPVALS
jgi:hypothetical protein